MTRRDVRYDVVVIGAGAAGMMCAATSGLRQRRVLLIEHYPVLGEKIRISGGGRCNFTNINASPANFLSHNPDFCKPALARYTPRDFLALVERYRIGYHEKKLGQLFCDDTARDLIAMLKAECDRGNVEWRMPCSVDAISREDRAWRIATPLGAVCCDSIVVATGGLTVPEIDAEEFLLGERTSEARLDSVLARQLPQRFAQAWCAAHDAALPMKQLTEKRLRELAAQLRRWALLPSGTLGFNKAEVTLGGVDTRGLSSKSMAATNVPGLYFIGEVVDVTGWLGG